MLHKDIKTEGDAYRPVQQKLQQRDLHHRVNYFSCTGDTNGNGPK